MMTDAWILLGAAAVIVLAADFIYNRIRKKASAAFEERKNRQHMARGVSKDENLADRYRK